MWPLLTPVKWLRMKPFAINFLKNTYNRLKNSTDTILLSIFKFFNRVLGTVALVFHNVVTSSYFIAFYNHLLKTFRKVRKVIYFICYLLYCEAYLSVVRPILVSNFNAITRYINDYVTAYRFTRFALNVLRLTYITLVRHSRRFCLFVWKKFIDFLFFTLYRNRDTIRLWVLQLRGFVATLLLLYILIYVNILGLLHNYIFFSISENFMFWNFSSYTGIFFIFLTFLNIDNLFLLILIVTTKIGLGNIFFQNWDYLYLSVGYNWIDSYCNSKLTNLNFLFITSYLDIFYDSVISAAAPVLTPYNFDFYSNPYFFSFGVLFFTTVILSWFFFSYLSLYGLFTLNLITLLMFLVSLLYYSKIIFVDQKVYIIKLCSWVFLSVNVRIDYYFLVDTISYSFMLLTTTIAFFVYIYAFSYFRYEPLVDRFLLFILSFVISMIFLVLSGNTIMLFLGWELIGFTSFCLINFWTTKTTTLKSAFKAFTFNKVSDFYMFIFVMASYTTYYTFDIQTLNNLVYNYESYTIFLLGLQVSFLEFLALMLIGAAFIKSAQIGGHAWLPDSMEAPVPASSLIHSATLVSAGVYLVLRFNFIFDATQYSKLIIPIVGSVTAAYGGVCAVAQSDVKKTLAYSTISHCGFLMVLCATEMNEFTILYLYVHGFFKAGVFMCVGNLLRITRGYQDNRRMGGLLKFLPFEYYCLVVGVFNLAGLPFTFGFFIKHLLLISLNSNIYLYYFVLSHCLIGAFSGLFYSYKLSYYTFVDFKKGNKNLYLSLNRGNYNSKLYTNSSVAATLAVLFLFITSYVIVFYLFKCFLANNYLFSDYMNTTLLSNYYSITNMSYGYLLNFSYINVTVVLIALYLIFSSFRRVQNHYALLDNLFNLIIVLVLTILFAYL